MPPKKRKANNEPHSKSTPFVHILFGILQETGIDDAISWNENGDGFYWKDDERMKPVLKRYFKHGNKESFHRQLNYHGFEKKACLINKEWSHFQHFQNDTILFKRDTPELIKLIKRKKTLKEHSHAMKNLAARLDVLGSQHESVMEQVREHTYVLNQILDLLHSKTNS